MKFYSRCSVAIGWLLSHQIYAASTADNKGNEVCTTKTFRQFNFPVGQPFLVVRESVIDPTSLQVTDFAEDAKASSITSELVCEATYASGFLVSGVVITKGDTEFRQDGLDRETTPVFRAARANGVWYVSVDASGPATCKWILKITECADDETRSGDDSSNQETRVEKPVNMETNKPTGAPSMLPSDMPSLSPSLSPSDLPSLLRSDSPSLIPSGVQSLSPSRLRSLTPSIAPSDSPSFVPTLVLMSSDKPSLVPSMALSWTPSDMPSLVPLADGSSMMPSKESSLVLLAEPSLMVSISDAPSDVPSVAPSVMSLVLSEAPSVVTPGKPTQQNGSPERPAQEPTYLFDDDIHGPSGITDSSAARRASMGQSAAIGSLLSVILLARLL